MPKAAYLLPLVAVLSFSSAVWAQDSGTPDDLGRKVDGFQLQDETFIDGLAKLNAQLDLSISIELRLKERLSDPNITDPRLTSPVPAGTVREVLDYLCALDRRFTWTLYKRTINVFPNDVSPIGDRYLMNRQLPDKNLEISDAAGAIFSTIEALPALLEQIAFSQSGALPGFPRPWNLSLGGLTVRQALDELAEHMGVGYGWTLGGANEFRVVRFHAKLLPTGASRLAHRPPEDDENYIQIVSVTVEPRTIHEVTEPNKATVTAQLLVHARMPSDSVATVGVRTYTTDPPGIKICYGKLAEKVHLDSNFITLTFPVQACPDTGQGKVTVAVTVLDVTGTAKIKESPSHKSWTAELVTVVP